jgi:hypothetical protein
MPKEGSEGVLSSTSYNSFDVISGGPRSITQKMFTDPVAVADVGTAVDAPARCSSTRGREHHTEVTLGAEYPNTRMIIGWRTYNQLGRVLFQADAFASTNSEKDGLLFDTAYGTRYSYNADGTPSCSIRSKGAPLVSLISTDEANEIYPSCVSHRFASNKEYVTTTDAASLLAGSPQTGVTKESGHRSPAGTQDLPAGANATSTTLDAAAFDYDALGHLRTMARFKNPVNGTQVSTTWHTDSLGWVTELDDPNSAPQWENSP